MQLDVAVMGTGPSGLALARACAQRGLSVVVVSPDPAQPWHANYAAWDDEVTEPLLRGAFEATWAAPGVWLDDESGERVLDRRYARFSTIALQAALVTAAESAGCRLHRGTVVAVDNGDRGATLRLQDDTEIHAAVAVDATGGATPFVQRVSDASPAWQVAYGQLVEVESHPWFAGEMVLMDWRGLPGDAPNDVPTFLYALPLGKNLLFVEETSLAARPGVALPTLQSRLQRRLMHRGIRVVRVLREERCRIPMGLPLPRRDQRLLAFGAAAGKVHPATGYQVARSFTEAPAVAEALAAGLQSGPTRASELGWQAIWPREALVQWELYSFGSNFLCTLGAAETRAFFDAFFDLETPVWRGYLSGTLGVAGLAHAMGQVFSNLSAPLRWELMRAGARTAPAPMLRAALAL